LGIHRFDRSGLTHGEAIAMKQRVVAPAQGTVEFLMSAISLSMRPS